MLNTMLQKVQHTYYHSRVEYLIFELRKIGLFMCIYKAKQISSHAWPATPTKLVQLHTNNAQNRLTFSQ